VDFKTHETMTAHKSTHNT